MPVRTFVIAALGGGLTIAILLVAGCDGVTGPIHPADTDGTTPDASPDSSPTDSSPTDTSLDAVDDVPAPAPEFVIGVNETGFNSPAYFEPLPEGADLEMEFGPQGLWMVVLAFKSRATFTPLVPGEEPKLYLEGAVVQDGTLLGELALQGQKMLPAGEGWRYYYNFFLVVDPFGAAGKDATIRFLAEDEHGHRVELEHPVRLVGGP